jgi:hypothetical protein
MAVVDCLKGEYTYLKETSENTLLVINLLSNSKLAM